MLNKYIDMFNKTAILLNKIMQLVEFQLIKI